jgi:hypothetical protein
MHRQVNAAILFLLLLGVAFAPGVWALPEHVSYQGQLYLNGQAYAGNADFKFAIVANLGSDTLWSNDATSSAGSEPASSLTLPVDAGVFSVNLGDVTTGQAPLDADVLADAFDAALRVWVDTGSGFEQLSDQPLSSAAFAQQSDAARRSLNDFSVPGLLDVGSLQMPSGAATGYVLTSDASGVGSWQPAPGGGGSDSDWTILGNDMFANVTGNVGIGTAGPAEKLHVQGNGLFQLAPDRSVSISTPGGWPGLIAISPNTHRRDVIFDDNGMRLLVGTSGAPADPVNGITIRENGWVGIGTLSPEARLDVVGQALAESWVVKNSGWTDAFLGGDGVLGGKLELHGPGGPQDYGISMHGGGNGGGIMDLYSGADVVTVELNGGTSSMTLGNGAQATAYLEGNAGAGGGLRLTNNAGTETYQIMGQAYGSGSQVNMRDANSLLGHQWTADNREWKVTNASGTVQILSRGTTGGDITLYQEDGDGGIVLDGDNGGDGEIRVYDQSGNTTVRIVGEDSGGNGRVITDVLEITGGADLSENFDVNGAESVDPGMVVCIDPVDAGKLVKSHSSYERTVAGVVSGAGGIRPGMVMGQQGSVANGKHPVALTGRVWTWCDASHGPIAPGDLLTTSDTPGHAMKVGDHRQANGAILGKAMSRLETGRGLVLVLVSLQ